VAQFLPRRHLLLRNLPSLLPSLTPNRTPKSLTLNLHLLIVILALAAVPKQTLAAVQDLEAVPVVVLVREVDLDLALVREVDLAPALVQDLEPELRELVPPLALAVVALEADRALDLEAALDLEVVLAADPDRALVRDRALVQDREVVLVRVALEVVLAVLDQVQAVLDLVRALVRVRALEVVPVLVQEVILIRGLTQVKQQGVERFRRYLLNVE
jgi:hypothetical protein